MANKPIIDIDINDEKFRQFYDLFKDYQDRLGDIPEAWARIEAQTRNAAKAGAQLSTKAWSPSEFRKVREEMRKTTEEQKKFHHYSLRSAIQMHNMAASAKSIGKSFLGVGKTIAKMAGWSLGLAGAGLFGLERLGSAAVNRQRSARGVGLNQGELRAWKTYMQQYVGEAMIGKVANEQSNLVGAQRLSYVTGLTIPQVQGMKADVLADKVAMAERKYWKTTPKSERMNLAQWTYGFSHFSDADEARRLSHTSAASLGTAWQKDRKAAAAWNIRGSVVDQWRTFTQSLSAAGNEIETVLTKRLAALAPFMSQFVDSITEDAKAFINSTLTPKNIEAFGEGLKSFAKYLGSPEFRSEVKNAGQALSDLVHAILWVAKKINGTFGGPDPTKNPYNYKNIKGRDGKVLEKEYVGPNYYKSNPDTPGYMNPRESSGIVGGPAYKWHPTPLPSEKTLGDRLNNPGDLRWAPNTPQVKVGKGYFAKFQTRAEGYRAMAALLKKYPTSAKYHHADTIRSIVNTYAPASDGNDDATYIRRVSRWTGYGADQKLNLNDPVQLSKLLSAMARQDSGINTSPKEIRVIIENKTGSNVHVSGNAAGH